jgi:hypothetical protein
LLADIRSSQAPYIIPNHLAQADPLIQRFEQWTRDHLKTGFSLQEAANALATSTRSLQRRCQEVLGKSPLSYFQDLRVERSCANAWDGECAIFVPTCANGAHLVMPGGNRRDPGGRDSFAPEPSATCPDRIAARLTGNW